MSETMTRPLGPVLVAALAAGLLAGCGLGGGADKAGGSRAPVELRLAVAYAADEPDAPVARLFAARVAALSHGSLRVHVVFDAAGQQVVDPEARVARMVRDGHFDLGWIGSRAWDELGVTSFQALQAPFLVTSYALLGRIATGPLASRMLAGLDRQGFVGLALVPDRLRYAIGVEHPLRSPVDFAGARVRVIPSRATDALMRALGATPVHLGNHGVDAAIARHEIDGQEASLGTMGGGYLTANVSFFAKALTLFAGRSAFGQLSDDQRAALRQAAAQTVAHTAAHPPPESARVRRYCDVGRVVTASRDDWAALKRAAQPVYAELEQDAQTRALIVAIRDLQATTPAPATASSPDCAHQTPTPRGRRVSPSILNGTYRWRLTKAGAVAAGDPNDPDIGQIKTMTLRDGKFLTGGGGTGTYEIIGNRIVLARPQSWITITFKRRDHGDLDVKPVLPMDPGDRFDYASAPWRRVGPPIPDIP